MAKTLAQILGYQNLTGIIQSPLGGVPNVWPEQFFTLKKPIMGNRATYHRVNASRQNAPFTHYGSASRKMGQEDTTQVNLQCVHSFNHIDHKAEVLTMLRQTDSPQAQKMGEQIVEAQAGEFRRKFDNARISAVNSMLRHGAIYFDGAGNMLPTSSGAVQTVDLGIPAANKNQLGGVLAATWATAGTDILAQLAALQLAAVQRSGRPITQIYYGSSVCGYLTGNTNIKEIMKSDAGLTSALRQNKIPAGFGIENVEWKPLHTSFFKDADGTNQTWFPGDFIVALPEITADLYQMQEGSYLVPKTVGGMSADAMAELANLTSVNGMFSYAKCTEDPPGIRQWAGDTFLPCLYDPNAVFIGDTAF